MVRYSALFEMKNPQPMVWNCARLISFRQAPCACACFMSMFKSHSPSFKHTHSLSLSISHSLSLDMLNNFCFHLYVQKSLSHSLTLSHSFSHSHSFNLSFTLSWHDEQLLFSCVCSKVTVYSRKLQCFFFTSASSSPNPMTLEFIELVPS